jgi:cleavage and polyadenylation specificity factor subunit 1
MNADITTGWVIQQLYKDDQIVAFDHHPATNRLILATSTRRDFRLPQDDELHPEWREESIACLPVVDHDCLKLLDPMTGRLTDTWDLDPYETVMCIKVLSLEVSEVTRVRRDCVCVGTAISRGEDLLTQGAIYIFDVNKVVPEPDHPETGRRLKLLAKIKDRGAVTAISSVGSEGFLLVSHGQKCYVRGLKEDGSLLPVAFLDTQCYVSVAKELRGTNMLMLGDAIKGLWFVGYTVCPGRVCAATSS